MRLGAQGAGFPSPLQEPGDERDTDAEQPGDPPLRPLAVVDRRGDPLAQVHRIGTHGCTLLIRCRLVPGTSPSTFIISNCPCATRRQTAL